MYRNSKTISDVLQHKDGISCLCIFVYLDYTKNNEIIIHFCHAQKYVPSRNGMNTIHNMSTGSHKRILIYISDCGFELLKVFFLNTLSLKNTIGCIRIFKQYTGQSKICQTFSFIHGAISKFL